MSEILAYLLIYVISVLICSGWLFAYSQEECPNISKKYAISESLILGVFGPVGVFVTWITTDFSKYGWKLTYERT